MNGECPNDADLERLIAGQMDEAEKAALGAHVASCLSCQLRIEQRDEYVYIQKCGHSSFARRTSSIVITRFGVR